MRIYGPYLRKDGRRHICIVKDDGTKTSKSYAKHLLEEKLNRKLVNDETADHIDENCSNDIKDNLQVLTRAKNAAKSRKPAEMSECICPECRTAFIIAESIVRRSDKVGRKGPFCSKVCAGRFNAYGTRPRAP